MLPSNMRESRKRRILERDNRSLDAVIGNHDETTRDRTITRVKNKKSTMRNSNGAKY